MFDILTSATAVRISGSIPVALPLNIDAGVARSSVQVNSQPAVISEAAPVWSPLVETAPALLGVPLPLPVAVWCYSYLPGDPRESSCGGPAEDVGGVLTASAGAGHTRTVMQQDDATTLESESSTVGEGVSSGPTAPQSLTVENVASAATAGAADGRMASAASASAGNIDIAGTVAIRAVRSSASVALGGVPGSASHAESLAISGASVLGKAVNIDGTGVHVAGNDAGGQVFAVQDQVNKALAAAGLEIRTVGRPPKVAADGTAADVTSGGLLVSLALPAAVGGRLEFVLGESSVKMTAHQVDAVPSDAAPAAAPDTELPSIDTLGDSTSSLPPPLPPVPGVGAGKPSTRSFHTQVSAASAAQSDWHIEFGPFALLVMALPVLAQLRLLSFSRRSS
ncbi:MAG TPA: hypothetical protein VHD87_12355 [Acidimicrobiales bacterium]|nr:hypothetical protein [Acidimicrobiales bacterium]